MPSDCAKWPKHYGELEVPVFAPRYYYPFSIKEDDYSKHIVLGKKADLSDYFFEEIKNVFLNDLPLRPDIIVLVPSSKLRKFSPTILNIGKKLYRAFGIPCKRIIKRVKEGPKQTDCESPENRFNSLHGCLRPIKRLNGECILLLDDTRASGVTFLECAKLLKSAGASRIIALCLGITSQSGKKKPVVPYSEVKLQA